MNNYTDGDLVHCTASFSDPTTRALIQPAGVVAHVENPAGVITTPAVVAEGTHFAIDVDTTGVIPGVWSYKFSSPNPKQGAKVRQFSVGADAFTP